jgi:uroporphyrinogen decarboxylase
LERLNPQPDPERFGHIRALLRRVRDELQGALPVIVFAGAPFTVATYCIGTGKDMDATRRFAAEQPEIWQGLLDRLSSATVIFLETLARDGADIYQLFDSWAGMLTREEYERWAQDRHVPIFAAARGIPRILFVKECPYLDLMAASGADVISLGTRHDLAAARRTYPQLTFQGNVNEELLRTGTPEQVAEATRRCLEAGGGRRHIVNLNHGVDRDTPPENVQAFVRTVQAYGT